MRSTRGILLVVLACALSLSVTPAFGDSSLRTVDFADANHGYLGGWFGGQPHSGFISATNDGGATWHAKPTGESSPIGLALNGAATARAVSDGGDMILSTGDGGASWVPNTPILGGGASFSDIVKTSTGYVAVGQWLGTADGDVGHIYWSANGISGWQRKFRGPIYPGTFDALGDFTPGPATYARMDKVAFAPDGLTGWAIGAEWSDPTKSTLVFKGVLLSKTTDGGATWTTPVANASFASSPLNNIVVTDATHAYAVGTGRKLLLTTNGGASWTATSLPYIASTQRLDSYGIDAFDATHMVAVGFTTANVGGVQWTTDGSTWTTRTVGAPAVKLRSVSMISATKWIVVGDNETIGRTSDGGATWTWTTATPPAVALTSPVKYISPSATTRIVSGTASDIGAGVASVGVSIMRDDGKFWRAGSGWVATQFWDRAKTDDGWDTWALTWMPDPTEVGPHTYTVSARAVDAVGLATTSSPFVVNTYALTPTAGPGGTISPSAAQTVDSGTDKTFTVVPDIGHHIVNVLRDGASIGASQSVTFSNITANHTISAAFAVDTFTITPTAGANGTITPSGPQTVDYGTNNAFTVTADPGYHIADVLKDGVSVGAVSLVTFTNVTASHTISATFAVNPVGTHAITPRVGLHGVITPGDVQVVTDGTDKTFTVTPDVGYHIVGVTRDGDSIGTSQSVTFTNVITDHTIGATFAINTYTITPTAGANGMISPGTTQTVDHGSSKTFTITPAVGYHIVRVTKDGDSIGASATVTFASITASHTIGAAFAINTYTLTYAAGVGGSVEGSTTQVVTHGASGTAVTAVPSAGKRFVKWSDGVTANPRTDAGVQSSKAVSAVFAINTYVITPSAGANGTISPGVAQTVNSGSSKTFIITPAPGYHIADVKKDGMSVGRDASYTFTNVTASHTISATFAATVRPVIRVSGGDRYGTAAALARKGWDPTGKLVWTGVKHVIVANGEPGKEPDPLTAAGLAGVYDAPVLTIQAGIVPAVTKTVITEIAKKNPGVQVHIVGGTTVVPEARWNDISRIPGVSQVPDRIAGRDRYVTSAAIANRMITVSAKTSTPINGVILIAADDPAAFYDALAAAPIAYARTMPMLSVQRSSVPPSVAEVLRSSALAGKLRYAASSTTYIGTVPAGTATRMATSSNRYLAATQIAKFAAVDRTWTGVQQTALAAKLPDALTGGAFLGRVGGIMLFTEPTDAVQTTSRDFIGVRRFSVNTGWVIGGTSVIPDTQETYFRNMLQP